MQNLVENCSNCKQIPEDILMLECNHDLCLNCASLIFISENNNSESRLLTCLQCGKSTELDIQSIQELQKINVELQIQLKINQSEQKKHLFDKKCNIISHNIEDFQLKSPSRSNIDFQNKTNLNYIRENQNQYFQRDNISHQRENYEYTILKQRTKCQDHQEEDILYYCFQCQSRCICPECVIHGAHQNHEVKTIKKAYPIIKQKIEEFQQNITYKLKQGMQRKQQLDTLIQQLNLQYMQTQKKEIRHKFDEKEKELIQICDLINCQNLKKIDIINLSLEEKQNEFKQILELVSKHENQQDQEIKENKEWENKLIYTIPEFDNICQKDIDKQLINLQNYISLIEAQIDVKELNTQANQINNQNQENEQNLNNNLKNLDNTIQSSNLNGNKNSEQNNLQDILDFDKFREQIALRNQSNLIQQSSFLNKIQANQNQKQDYM